MESVKKGDKIDVLYIAYENRTMNLGETISSRKEEVQGQW
jgi:hypothetical protein